MQKVIADLSLWYEDWLKLDNNYSTWNNYCKVLWRINEIKVNIDKNSECLWYFSIKLKNINKNIYSYWVQNWDENRNCWSEAWLYKKINWKAYNPQVWDYIIAKINPENNYINELYETKWKSINELNSIIKSINIPDCVQEKNVDYGFFYYIVWWIIILILVIFIFLKKMKKLKKSA